MFKPALPQCAACTRLANAACQTIQHCQFAYSSKTWARLSSPTLRVCMVLWVCHAALPCLHSWHFMVPPLELLPMCLLLCCLAVPPCLLATTRLLLYALPCCHAHQGCCCCCVAVKLEPDWFSIMLLSFCSSVDTFERVS